MRRGGLSSFTLCDLLDKYTFDTVVKTDILSVHENQDCEGLAEQAEN